MAAVEPDPRSGGAPGPAALIRAASRSRARGLAEDAGNRDGTRRGLRFLPRASLAERDKPSAKVVRFDIRERATGRPGGQHPFSVIRATGLVSEARRSAACLCSTPVPTGPPTQSSASSSAAAPSRSRAANTGGLRVRHAGLDITHTPPTAKRPRRPLGQWFRAARRLAVPGHVAVASAICDYQSRAPPSAPGTSGSGLPAGP